MLLAWLAIKGKSLKEVVAFHRQEFCYKSNDEKRPIRDVKKNGENCTRVNGGGHDSPTSARPFLLKAGKVY